MISKLGVGILLSVATLFFATPTNTFAASSATTAKIKKYFTQLKKLPNGASPASKVNSLVTKLTKLDAKKALKYYKLGLTKLSHESYDANAAKIAKNVTKIVKKSDLPDSSINKISGQVTKTGNNPPPPATSASAMLELTPADYCMVVA